MKIERKIVSKYLDNEFINDFENFCKLRNPKGSECGTCQCKTPKECTDPPEHLLRGLRFVDIMEQSHESR